MISTDLQTMKANANSAFDAAIAAAQAWEGLRNQTNKTVLCDALQALKDLNNDENDAINDAMAIIGCGA